MTAFDPAKTVILESPPTPAPALGSVQGSAEILSQTTDSLTLKANVPQPSLLIITDSYSRFFRATPLPGSHQRHYDVLPADYTLMAIPLAAGNHRLRLEYVPGGYLTGRWISLAGWGVYLGVLGIVLAGGRRLPKPIPPTAQVTGEGLRTGLLAQISDRSPTTSL